MMTEYVRLNGLPFLRKVLTPAIKFYLTKENLWRWNGASLTRA